MKATKKIVGAAVALVAAVALSAGSTFAWFASNDKVTATNMQIQATVPMNLWIEKYYLDDAADVNSTEVVMNISGSSMSPAAISAVAVNAESDSLIEPDNPATTSTAVIGVSATNLYVGDAVFEEASKPTAEAKGTPKGYNPVATGAPNDTVDVSNKGLAWTMQAESAYASRDIKDYVVSSDMTLANKAKAADVTATVTVAWSTATPTYKFLRTGFLVGSAGTYKFYSIKNTGDFALQAGAGTENINTTGSKIVYTDLITNFAQNTVQTVTFLAWFDGNDDDCFVNNAMTLGTFSLSIEFKAVETKTPGPGV